MFFLQQGDMAFNESSKTGLLKRGPNLFFKYFYFLFGPGLFYPLRVPAKVQIFFGSLAEPLTLLHPKMELVLTTSQKSLTLEGHPK